MRSIKLAMIALFAIFAFGAIAAASASAFPEFKSAAGNLAFTGTSGTSTLRGESASAVGTITCEKDTSSGLILNGTMAVDKVEVSFSGKCKQQIGSSEGTCVEPIKIKLAAGTLGLLTASNHKVVLLLTPEAGKEFVKVSCANGSTTIEGEIVGEFPEKVGLTNQYNKLLKSFTLEYKSSGVKQLIQEVLLLPSSQMTGTHLEVNGFFGGEASEETTETISIGGGEITT